MKGYRDLMTTPMISPRPNIRRNADLMNAEPPVTATTVAGIKAARGYFDKAKPYLSNAGMYLTTVGTLDDYSDALDRLVFDVQRAKQNVDLTNQAKWRAVDAVTAAWEPAAAAMVASVEAQVAAWDRKLTAAAMPPAPITDRATLEAALSNARADARMVLEAAKDADQETPHRLAEMARGDDPVLAFLVLGTSWPATFMRAHDLKSAPAVWEHERAKLLGGVLTDAALAAYEQLPGLPHARKAATSFRMAHSFMLHGNADYFERPDGA